MKILIIIDMQNDFIRLALGTKEAEAIIPYVVKRIKEANGKLIITTKDTHGKDYLNTLEGKMLPIEHCLINTEGWEIDDEIIKAIKENKDIEGYIDLYKETFGSLKWNEILGAYDDIEEIEICGLCTDICVISNALILRAMFPNTKIIVHENCCAGVTIEKHNAAIEVMKSCQIEVV